MAPLPAEITVTPRPMPQPSDALTLADCYRLALKRSETIAIQQELIRETEGRFLQSISTALPRVSFVLTEKRQDGSGGSAFTLSSLPERKFTFSQPLFAGFKEFAAMAGSRAERRERVFQKARAEQLLLVDVADAFYLVLEEQEDLSALETTRMAWLQRVDELKQREQLGRSRRSEVVSAEAQLRRTEAEIERIRGETATAGQLLEFLTGRSPLGPLDEMDATLPELESQEHYVAQAGARADVRAAEEAWRVARREVNVAQAKFFPTVDLDANYYTKRAGVAADVDWDATVTVDVPLFQGGQATGALREATSKARQAKLTFERTQREAVLDIQDLSTRLQAAVARSAALKRALDAAEENYRLQVEDDRLHLVNNLDVLLSLQLLQDAQREFVHARAETKRFFWQLRAATGQAL
ncbi:MAG: TolC family protein [Candidatus Omnitrophica bacterium]|nr:TolC family protein [Candidatus Omnitrophota bacterium]